jgi:hypothetical protein
MMIPHSRLLFCLSIAALMTGCATKPSYMNRWELVSPEREKTPLAITLYVNGTLDGEAVDANGINKNYFNGTWTLTPNKKSALLTWNDQTHPARLSGQRLLVDIDGTRAAYLAAEQEEDEDLLDEMLESPPPPKPEPTQLNLPPGRDVGEYLTR